jgi:hypothetical protein
MHLSRIEFMMLKPVVWSAWESAYRHEKPPMGLKGLISVSTKSTRVNRPGFAGVCSFSRCGDEPA